MPEKPILDDDPIVSRSFAPHYVIATILLVITLFWALWDEDFGQRPWKEFQREWKTRYSAFLKTARSQSGTSQKEIEGSSEYQALKQSYDQAAQSAAPRMKEINERLRELSGKILAVQNVFTDRRAWVNAKNYQRKSLLQYSILMVFFLTMIALPIKMLLRLMFHIKYVWITPWFNV